MSADARPTSPSDDDPLPASAYAVRAAAPGDLAALLDLEEAGFVTDRLDRRALRRHLRSESARLIVADHVPSGAVVGYALVLFHRGRPAARLYSITVASPHRGQQLGERLLREAEAEAIARGCAILRLESRVGGLSDWYARQGYREVRALPAYYTDGADGVRMERILRPPVPGSPRAPRRRRGPATLVLVDRLADSPGAGPGRLVLTTRTWLTDPPGEAPTRILNLSRDYAYLGLGYTASLLAEARGLRVVPDVATLLALHRGGERAALRVLDDPLRRIVSRLKDPPASDRLDLVVCFGRADDPRFDRFARELYDRFRAPILRLRAKKDAETGRWKVRSVRVLTVEDLDETTWPLFQRGLRGITRAAWRTREAPRYAMAILHDPKESIPPSNARALENFVRIGGEMGFAVELITKRDLARLSTFDALFIRETTGIAHHTFRFALKADEEGLVVIDDPVSIRRCTNKVYLAEALAAAGIPSPPSVIVDARSLDRAAEQLGFPLVLKVPDGAFSRGVVKVTDRDSLHRQARALLEHSAVILAQAWVPTDHDWRIGLLDGAPLFACRYMMARGHWQIVHHQADGSATYGRAQAVRLQDVPSEVLEVALRAGALMGDGLYGVDVKPTAAGPLVIEVNDNPNLDAGIEDALLKDELYRRVLGSFLRRLEAM